MADDFEFGGESMAGGGAGGEAPIPFPPGCDFFEQHDKTNGFLNGGAESGEPEKVLWSDAAGDDFVLCGQVNTNHWQDDGDPYTDIDLFDVAESSDAQKVFHVELTTDLPLVDLEFAGLEDSFLVPGGHAVLLGGGHLNFDFEAGLSANSFPYRFSVRRYALDQRCPVSAMAPSYVEAHDGPQFDGNDMFDEYGHPTPSTTDGPEATGLVLAAGERYVLSGTTSHTSPNARDGDAYAFRTGPNTNELVFRNSASGSFEAALSKQGDEFAHPTSQGAALEPDTDYVLWLSASPGVEYRITLCPETYSF